MWSNKEADIFPEINKSFTFHGMGQYNMPYSLSLGKHPAVTP